MQRKITIVDYGLGNIFSVRRAFEHMGAQVEIATSAQQIIAADFLVLPGVGAFKKGMQTLDQLQFIDPIKSHAKAGKPLLGICLGMQLLFDSSIENGHDDGLGLISGDVVRIVPPDSTIKVPHIGWSRLATNSEHSHATVFTETLNNQFAYFVHSYHPLPSQDDLLATTTYHGYIIHAIVMKDNIIGCQFHPEKSGLNMLKFLREISFLN